MSHILANADFLYSVGSFSLPYVWCNNWIVSHFLSPIALS